MSLNPPFHWKVFAVSLAVFCVAYYLAMPGLLAPEPVANPMSAAIGACAIPATIMLFSAGVGRITRLGTDTGLYIGLMIAASLVFMAVLDL